MKNKIILIIIILGFFSSCITSKYTVMKQSQIEVQDLDNSVINYIPMADELIEKSAVLDSSYKLIHDNKLYTLENYVYKLERSGANSSDVYLAKTIWAITQLNYSQAQQSLARVTEKDYTLLKSLLTIDLNYEIERTGNEFNFKTYLQRYQNLIDTYPENIVLRKIVAIRLRYLRYKY
ncbi:MAG: hypothetical protein PHR83_19035 [Paludibacter sp.]|nr:hypothetical protein [Paludibacter sp.]